MPNIVEPQDIIVEVLRSSLSEPVREDGNARQINTSKTISATTSQTVFNLDHNPHCINSVTAGGVAQTKFDDYQIDLKNKKITFSSAPGNGVSVVIDYDYGQTWIYPDKPRDDLSEDSYPRISVYPLSEPVVETGIGETNLRSTITLQVDVLTYQDQICVISNDQYEGASLATYVSRRIIDSLKDWRDNVYPALDSFEVINNFPAPYLEELNVHKRILEVRFKGFNVGI